MVEMDRLRLELHNKSLEIKKKIKELNNILDNLYNREKDQKSKDIFVLKRNVDKVGAANRLINNLHLSEEDKKHNEDNEDIAKIHKDALSSISKLSNFYKEKLGKELWNVENNEVKNIKRNIDSLRMAYEEMKRLDFDTPLKSKNYKDIEL
jgi:hypothetical protein